MDLQRERGLQIDGKVAPKGETITNLKRSAFPGSSSRINNPNSDQTQQFQAVDDDETPEYRQYASKSDEPKDEPKIEGQKPKRDCLGLKLKLRELNKQIMKKGSKLAEVQRRINNLEPEVEGIREEIEGYGIIEPIGKIAGVSSRSSYLPTKIGGYIAQGLGELGKIGVDELEEKLRNKLALLKDLEEEKPKLENEVLKLKTLERITKKDYDKCRNGSGNDG